MVDRLLQLMPRVFRHEGGYADHPRDPGGATNHGITHLTLARHRGVERVSRAQVKALTKREATAIYRSSFWERVQGGALPIGVDYAVLDASINSGPGRGVRWLQKAIGAKPDGKVGPVTRRLVAAADAAAVVENMLDRREAFLRRLKTFDAFGRGWMRRVDAVRRDALADIERARGTPEERVAAQVETILNPPSPLLPAARPRQSGHVTRALLETYRSLLPTAYRHAGVVVLFVRGYFSRSFGDAGNDRGVYDDALFLVWPGGCAAFNANADPSRFRRGVASLKSDQAIIYREGPHGFSRPGGPIPAFRQLSDVTVIRDRLGEDRDGGGKRFWTNLHPGGSRGTSSLGCLTVPPEQWNEFYAMALDRLAEAGQSALPVILVEYDGNNPPIPAPEPAPKPTLEAPTIERDPSETGLELQSETATSPAAPDPQSKSVTPGDETGPEGEPTMTQTKSPLKSLTIQGALIAMAAPALGIVGVEIAPADVQGLVQAGEQIMTAVGGIMAIIGRVRANSRIA